MAKASIAVGHTVKLSAVRSQWSRELCSSFMHVYGIAFEILDEAKTAETLYGELEILGVIFWPRSSVVIFAPLF